MSASSKKKLRKEQKAAAMTQRQKAAKKEATKLKVYTWTFWIVMILIVGLVAGIALSGPVNVMIERMGTSIVVGDHNISHTELNYFYIDAINQYCNQYSSYISYLLDTSAPLDEQVVDATTGTTWADNFLDMAISNAKNTYALYDAANEAGYEMSAEEKEAMDELYGSMDTYAKDLGYKNADEYLQAIYGASADKKSYQEYYKVTVLASSYYAAYSEDLEESYDEVVLREFEKETPYQYNSYSYAYFYMSVDDFKTGGTKGEDGKTTYTDDEIKAAEEAVKQAAESLAIPENSTVEKLNAAIAEMEKAQAEAEKEQTKEEEKTEEKTEDATEPSEESTEPTEGTTEPTEESKDETDTETEEPTEEEEKEEDETKEDKEETKYSTATENTDVLYSKVSSVMNEWIRDEARKNGDITALAYETTSTDSDGKETKTLKGYYVVLYLDSNDNNFALANVRHILVAFEGGTTNSTTGTTTYSQAEKDAAKKTAEALLEQWKKGDATEESFGELANKESDDGDGTTGGLYEDVYPGQMVTNFNDWCFDEARKPGDTGIVESTYGYHVMYYVGDSEQNYRDHMITEDKLTEDMEAWQTALNEAMSLEEKDTSHVKKDLVLSTSGLT
ncbi:MAG: peptidylprolyl isomerase [Oscillospiraceae bacterium]|nr:peptidylprolyl isomerase [Oscillospiraceae bacterium]